MKRPKQRMCIINPVLVPDIAPLAGGQADIMGRIGISWNSWIKIAGGEPVRLSLGERLRARIVACAHESDALRARYAAKGGAIDGEALSAAFLLPLPGGAHAAGESRRTAAIPRPAPTAAVPRRSLAEAALA